MKHSLPFSPCLLTACLLLLPVSVQAQNEFTLGTLEPGQLLLNLSATEQMEVDQDTLNASLEYTAQGRDRIALQNEVNAAMAKALDLLAESTAVEYSTSGYQVYIFEPGRPARSDIENPSWRARQGLSLTSMDSAALLELVGKLQTAGLTMSNLYYSLSPARYREVADGLTGTVLARLRERAAEAAAALGKGSAELVEVSLNDSPNYPMYRERAFTMAVDSALAAPVAEPGKSQVSITVSARAVLSP